MPRSENPKIYDNTVDMAFRAIFGRRYEGQEDILSIALFAIEKSNPEGRHDRERFGSFCFNKLREGDSAFFADMAKVIDFLNQEDDNGKKLFLSVRPEDLTIIMAYDKFRAENNKLPTVKEHCDLCGKNRGDTSLEAFRKSCKRLGLIHAKGHPGRKKDKERRKI
ncbi:hypothetical protein QPK87_23355 [Kamptonema cortianum]|nr:hypothetical protein [Oscillatoria laete-virens]MDK3159490.1 hypothetical protein [Kamptonema cortianum]MDL5044564.1 hypothetical protein [Oscillatoria amoena NRMC-F 0135]MDL5053030.1 hypothetical protein [Oscillatoria laete-virens NRMC-F 0139]